MTDVMHPLAASFRVDGPSGEVFVGVHGFTGSPAHLRLLARHVHQRHGHTVLLPRLAGHGTTMEDMAGTGRRHWLASVRDALRLAFDLGERVHLFGFSMGGLLAVMAAADEPVVSLATLNTPFANRDIRPYLLRIASPFRPYRMWDRDGEEPTGEAREYWVHYDGMPTRSVVEVERLRVAALTAARRVTVPTLIIHSRQDETVHPRSAGAGAAALTNATVQVHWLERSPHNSLLFDERDDIHALISAHLDAVSPGI